MSFADTWLPNIACTISGCVLSWAIGYRQGKQAMKASGLALRMLRTQLQLEEEKGTGLKLVRDKDGNITGGRVIEIQPPTGQLGLTEYAPSLKVGPASLGGIGTVSPPPPPP
jgi:hypothetical protein